MRTLLLLVILNVGFLSFSQKDTPSNFTHHHSYAFEFGGAAGFNWAVGYEYWLRKGLNGFGASVGIGMKGYRRNGGSGNKGEIYNGHIGAHYTLGKKIGLRVGVNFSSEINPKAYSGYYNTNGEQLTYPLNWADDQKLPGDAVRIYRNNISLDIGPYFSLINGELYLYPKFSYGFFTEKNYWHYPPKKEHFNFPYCGLTVKFDVVKIHLRFKNRKKKRRKLINL